MITKMIVTIDDAKTELYQLYEKSFDEISKWDIDTYEQYDKQWDMLNSLVRSSEILELDCKTLEDWLSSCVNWALAPGGFDLWNDFFDSIGDLPEQDQEKANEGIIHISDGGVSEYQHHILNWKDVDPVISKTESVKPFVRGLDESEPFQLGVGLLPPGVK